MKSRKQHEVIGRNGGYDEDLWDDAAGGSTIGDKMDESRNPSEKRGSEVDLGLRDDVSQRKSSAQHS